VIAMLRSGIWTRCSVLVGIIVLAACAMQTQQPEHFNVYHDVYHIGFEPNSFTIGPAGEQVIRDVASLADSNKSASITIVGRTDIAGSIAYNNQLVQKRATAVHDALVATGKIVPERIETAWTTAKPESSAAAASLAGPDNRVVDIFVH
jgi:outer membrane protein OmpA-like peptidoglycan-associated protein